jgi:hypothetical protein
MPQIMFFEVQRLSFGKLLISLSESGKAQDTVGVARFFLKYPNGKIYQISINYTKWPYNRPNAHEIYQHLPLQDPPKFAQIRIFWFENTYICHLATLGFFRSHFRIIW